MCRFGFGFKENNVTQILKCMLDFDLSGVCNLQLAIEIEAVVACRSAWHSHSYNAPNGRGEWERERKKIWVFHSIFIRTELKLFTNYTFDRIKLCGFCVFYSLQLFITVLIIRYDENSHQQTEFLHDIIEFYVYFLNICGCCCCCGPLLFFLGYYLPWFHCFFWLLLVLFLIIWKVKEGKYFARNSNHIRFMPKFFGWDFFLFYITFFRCCCSYTHINPPNSGTPHSVRISLRFFFLLLLLLTICLPSIFHIPPINIVT